MENKEHRNLSQETAICDKQFDKILEMNTEVERRWIAAMAMQGMLSNPKFNKAYDIYYSACCNGGTKNIKSREDYVAMRSVRFADALIAQLNKKKI